MVLLECMAAGKPIVATRVGDIPKVIENYITGILVEPCKEEEITNAIRYLLKNNNISLEIGKNAKRRVKEKVFIKGNVPLLHESI